MDYDDDYDDNDNDDWLFWDFCYECSLYGDNFHFNEDGEVEWACDDCAFNDFNIDYWDD